MGRLAINTCPKPFVNTMRSLAIGGTFLMDENPAFTVA
jgi:hypothetical protein